MQFILEKLDGRHTGRGLWKYRLRIQNDLYAPKSYPRNFHMLRSWMIEQYGLSSERDEYKTIALACIAHEGFDPPWCWHVDRDTNNMYIYIRNDEVLSHTTLRWR